MYPLCEYSWSALYEQRFGRYTPDPKNSYKRLVLTTGTVTYYHLNTHDIHETELHNVKMYGEDDNGRYTINAHNECWFYTPSSSLLVETDVVDMFVNQYLHLLTLSSYDLYAIDGNPVLHASHPIQGKRILEPTYVETHEDKVMRLCSGGEWLDVTAKYTRRFELHFNDGSTVVSRFKYSNIESWLCGCVLMGKNEAYLCNNYHVCTVCHVLAESVLKACSYEDTVGMTTMSGKLLYWNGTAEDDVEQLDNNVLPCLFYAQHRLYYIRRT